MTIISLFPAQQEGSLHPCSFTKESRDADSLRSAAELSHPEFLYNWRPMQNRYYSRPDYSSLFRSVRS